MTPPYITKEFLHEFISSSLKEDVGVTDHSTQATIAKNQNGVARLLVKQNGIIAGLEIASEVFRFVDSDLMVQLYFSDGDQIKIGDVAFQVSGSMQSILTSERLVLNIMQRMSGIATKTSQLVKLLSDTKTKLLDTRKTTPLFRAMEKWAVQIGGGSNHRLTLSELIMLKDNHIDACGGIRPAVQATRKYLSTHQLELRIEVETRSLDEVEDALAERPDIIMLDNMSVEEMTAAVKLIQGKCLTEASGGINETNIRAIAQTGVDFVSVGAITHSVSSLDMSLKIILE